MVAFSFCRGLNLPIFLDQSLRKSILAKIRESFGRDAILSGQVRVLEQESFLPEASNQVLLTDVHVSNESLDASNRVTDLYGTLTFTPIKKPESTFLFWAQENSHKEPLISQGFYHLTLKKTADTDLPDQGWQVSSEVIPRVTETRKPWIGLRIDFEDNLLSTNTSSLPSRLQVIQDFDTKVSGDDYLFIGKSLYLKRFSANTQIIYDNVDITAHCYYWDLESKIINFRKINPPIQLPDQAILETLSAYNLTYRHPLSNGFTISRKGQLTWKHPVESGVSILLQYYILKPLLNWSLPSEFCIALEKDPLTYASGEQALNIVSNLRGVLPPSSFEIKSKVLRILEPIPNEFVSVDYRYFLESLPPTSVYPSTFSDDVVPGVCLTFTDNFIDGDEVVLIKHETKKSIGEEHGGNNIVEMSLRIRSADDQMLERMTSRIFFLFTDQESLMELSNQGISLENSISYARSYEERDGNSEKWIVNTFNLKIHHTWKYLIPHVTDLNSMTISIGAISCPTETGAPTFKELLCHSTEPHWLQPY